jgi:pimeloyl-ACP methyl ester carboxylesterase
MVEQIEFSGRVAGIQAPALLMAGGRDLLVSEKGLRDLAEELSAARTAVLPGCGHLAFVTHPEEVAREARRFLLN